MDGRDPGDTGDPQVIVDLHCHSDASDGSYTPDIVASRLAAARVQYAALTDHQTISGTAAFRTVSIRHDVVPITGAEITGRIDDREVHLLGYGFDSAGGIVDSLFSRAVTAAEVIAAVHESGGIVVLAHPLTTEPDQPTLESLVEKLVRRGLDGIEAYYKRYSREEREYLVALADRWGLVTSGGSDFHGSGTNGSDANGTGSDTPGVEMPRERWKQFRSALGDRAAPAARNPGVDEPNSGEETSRYSGETAGTPATSVVDRTNGVDWRWLVLRVAVPSVLVIVFFVFLLFAVLIPTVEELLLDRKRETTAELTNSAWSILSDYDRAVREGDLTLEEAQTAALERIRRLRYGPEQLDYFWITDMHPYMVMHPYRTDLEGTDLTEFTDPDGVRLFVEFVQAVRDRSSGYVRYVWQWQDDPERLEAKESYVRGFEPWGWVIGTGLYVDDVDREIAAITGQMIDAAFLVILIATVLLVTVIYQSLKVERRRSAAERELHLSHERYRLLVEASTAGSLLLVDTRCTYANRPLLELLGYTAQELALLDLHDVVLPDTRGTTADKLRRVAAGEEIRESFEVQLKPKGKPPFPALLTSTPVYFSGKKGVILNVQDIAHHEAMRTALGESHAKYEMLTRTISSGVFRFLLDTELTIIEANPAGRRILGLDGESNPSAAFREFTARWEQFDLLLEHLSGNGTVRDLVLQIRRRDGRIRTVRLSAVRSDNASRSTAVCDAIMEDISEQSRTDAQRDTLISQLQTSLLFLTEPVRNTMTAAVSCSLDTTVSTAIRRMNTDNAEALVVSGPDGAPVGIVTDYDIRRRVVAEEVDTTVPVSRIMSAPVVTINETAPVFEAFMLERKHDIDHLVVTDSTGNLAGIVRSSRTVRLDEYSPVVLLRQISSAGSPEDLADCHGKLPILVGSLVESGAGSENICHVTTAVSDAITERVISLALEQLGPPPLPFAFVALGSEAREEQTLATDQDNALVYEDNGTDSDAAYFLKLGEIVCRGLDEAGYPYCRGDAMAVDPRWNGPLSQWRRNFSSWIAEPDGTALAHCNVFFDLRCIYGDRSLVRRLWQHIDRQIDANPAFFSHMALNALQYKPPIGVFGQLVTESTGGQSRAFNIKETMIPIVDFARLYALKHHLGETNTFNRLEQLHALGVLQEETYRGTVQAYDQLMRLRYRHQVEQLKRGEPGDNLVDPRDLTQIDSSLLKTTLSRISTIQKKVSYDFRGTA